MPDLMKELSNSLHFTVEGLPTLDGQDRVTLSSKGNLEDILRRIILLPGKGLVTFYNGKMIDRIVIVGLNAGGSNSQSVAQQAETQTQPEGTTDPAAPVKTSTPAATASTSAVASASPPAHQVNALLQTQLNLPRQVETGTADDTAIPLPNPQGPTTASSMAALTQTARLNILTLKSALRAVCIGPNCAR